jgi:arabinofuranosyltransferase
MTASFPDGKKRAVVLATALVLLIVLVRTAWVSDDAYITFRTVDNFLHGFGLRWNVDSRVESFTHPLWLFAMIGATAVTGEVYYTSIFLSIGLTLLAVVLLLWRFTSSVALAFLAASVILLSKAFVDYSTSGLENPLTHLLLVLFFIVAASSGPRYLFWLSLLASLVMLNRVDAGLLVLPVLVLAVWKNGVRRSLVPVGLGVVPFVAWEVFSLIYYGFPAPNTAYAKLDTGVERGDIGRRRPLRRLRGRDRWRLHVRPDVRRAVSLQRYRSDRDPDRGSRRPARRRSWSDLDLRPQHTASVDSV